MSDFKRRKITPETLKLCLDEYLGPDGRTTQFSYEYETKILLKMGFSTIDQIEDCIKDYDDDQIRRTSWGHRQGQIKRFIVTLVAAMGDNFVRLHPWAQHDWFPPPD
jgi:hypothetical protein